MWHLSGATRIAFLVFFVTHIPITMFVDGQAALPHAVFPTPALKLVAWYCAVFKDRLMAPPYDVWFSAIVTGEVLLQLPWFFVAVYALATRNVDGAGWFRSACMIYGAHTSTTLIPILATIIQDPTTATAEKAMLAGFYLPYLIFPFWMMVIGATAEDVFGPVGATKRKRT